MKKSKENKDGIYLFFFIFRLIIGILAIASFIILLISGENILIWIPAFLLSIVWVVFSLKEIITYFKN